MYIYREREMCIHLSLSLSPSLSLDVYIYNIISWEDFIKRKQYTILSIYFLKNT